MSLNKLFGWTTALTYETREPLGFDHYFRLLDEMEENEMKRLIVMDSSHYHYDPNHQGMARPVLNPRLKSMVDTTAINASPSTEFLSRVIGKAHSCGIELYIEIKYSGFYGIRDAYLGVEFATNRQGIPYHHAVKFDTEKEYLMYSQSRICCDNAQAHQFMRDQLEDLLKVYPQIDGIVMEHPDYPHDGCYCKSTQEKFMAETGMSISEAAENQRVAWQNERIGMVIKDLVNLAKERKKNLRFGIYSGFSPPEGTVERYQELKGQKRETLQRAGLDFVMPYLEGRHKGKEEFEIEKVLDYMKPLTCYIHTCVRRNPPRTYHIPKKDPTYIHRIIKWFLNYYPHHPHVEGMSFWNEANTTAENRQAIYKALKMRARS